MPSFPSSLSSFFTRTILSFVISSLIVFIYLPSDNSFAPFIFQRCLAQVTPSSILIAKNDGGHPAYLVNDYKQGLGSENDTNYILGCDVAQKMLGTSDFYLKVNVGIYNDYIIPYDPDYKTKASLCDALTKIKSSPLMGYYLYTSVDPGTAAFTGTPKVVPKAVDNYLGGSDLHVADDGRYTLTRWGFVNNSEGKTGACCFRYNTSEKGGHGGWGNPFTITAHKLDGSYLYMTNMLFANYDNTNQFLIKGNVNDLYLDTRGTHTCNWTIKLIDYEPLNSGDAKVNSEPLTFNECEFEVVKTYFDFPFSTTFTCTIRNTTKTFWPSPTEQSKTVNVPFSVVPCCPPSPTTPTKATTATKATNATTTATTTTTTTTTTKATNATTTATTTTTTTTTTKATNATTTTAAVPSSSTVQPKPSPSTASPSSSPVPTKPTPIFSLSAPFASAYSLFLLAIAFFLSHSLIC